VTHKNFRTLSEPLRVDPVHRAQLEETRRATRIVLALADLRGLNCEPGEEPRLQDGVAEDALRIVDEDSLFLTYLREYIEDMGGRLEVTAVFPDRRVQLLDSKAEGTSQDTEGRASLPE
jgi:hypothetical protein